MGRFLPILSIIKDTNLISGVEKVKKKQPKNSTNR